MAVGRHLCGYPLAGAMWALGIIAFASAGGFPPSKSPPARDPAKVDRARDPDSLPKLQEIASGGPYCGIYSLWACLAALDIKADANALFSADYIGSLDGSSAAELITAAEHCGAYAKAYVQLTVGDLQRARGPMLLHVRGSWMDRTYNHWVAYLGTEGNRAKIFDPPHPVDTFSYAELLANWDGMALCLSNLPIDNSLLYEARVDYALKVAALLFAVYLIRRFTRRDAQGPIVGQRWSTGLGRVVGQAAVLVIVAGVFGIGYHALAETGFLRNPTAVAEVARRYYSAEFPEKALDEMIALVKRKQCVVVDARFAGDFHRGALPGAINLAVDSPLPERQNALLGVSHSSPIVVYCQSTDCRFSDEIATFLKYNGYSNVSIFRGGYREWRARIGTPPVDNSSDEAAVSKDDGGAG